MCLVYDSNVFIYQLNDGLNEYGRGLLKKGFTQGGAYSVITKIEVLGFPQSKEELTEAIHLFNALDQINLNAIIQETAITLRQTRKIKVPDAIIAATALCLQLPLVTRNLRDFQWIEGLELIDPMQGANL
jgi:predicted nucleic acid-binding protein